MQVKQYTIGSDDDDITVETLNNLQTIESTEIDPLKIAQDIETALDDSIVTYHLEEFIDDFWKVAYDNGYKTYESLDQTGVSNELIYLVR